MIIKVFFKNILISILCATAVLFSSGAEIQVSSTKVPKGQNVRIKIVAEGGEVFFPDIAKMSFASIENVRRTNKLETRYVNGKLTSKNKKILSFDIYPQKNITIPSFEIKVDGKIFKTKPVDIKVLNTGVNISRGIGDFTLSMKSNKQSVYAGEPLLVTVDAVEPPGSDIVQLEYRPPEFKDFFVKPIGTEKRYRQGEAIVHKLEYLLIPQKAGKISIPPAQVRIGIKDKSAPADPFGIFGVPVRWNSVRSNTLSLDVKQIPEKVDLVGKYTVSSKIDRSKVKMNKPVNYTLTISGEGNLEEFEDPVFDIDGVTVYSDDAVVKSRLENGKIHSTYTKKYVFIAESGFTIPSLVFKEFNYNNRKIRKLTTRSYPIAVTGGKAVSKNQNRQKKLLHSRSTKKRTGSKSGPKKISKEDILLDRAYYAKMEYEQKAKRYLWYFPLSFFGGMLTMFLLTKYLFRANRRAKAILGISRTFSKEEALKILYPHINEDPEVEKMVRQLYEVQNGNLAVTIDKKKMNELASRYSKE